MLYWCLGEVRFEVVGIEVWLGYEVVWEFEDIVDGGDVVKGE